MSAKIDSRVYIIILMYLKGELMSDNPSTTNTRTAVPDTPPSMVKKIDNITYRVWAHFSETSTETTEDKIKRMLRDGVYQMMESE